MLDFDKRLVQGSAPHAFDEDGHGNSIRHPGEQQNH
jgi:hypothetical protein